VIPFYDAIQAALADAGADGRARSSAGAPDGPQPEIHVTGAGVLPSRFDVTGLAVASIAAAGAEIARLAAGTERTTGAGAAGRLAPPSVEVDRRLASMWFAFSIRPIGWTMPSPWDPIAGDYPTRDGWIRLHTNAPHHRRAALSVLAAAEEKSAVAAAVAAMDGEALEAEIVAAGGCAATMRTAEAWSRHAQGSAVAAEPLIAWRSAPLSFALPPRGKPDPARPLAGIRVLDLTRVLAGPVGSRLLAAFGADVLRIDPPDWDEPGVIPEVTVGKRCVGLDLEVPADRARFEQLLASADVLIHGYRPGALARLGYDEASIRARNPALVDVALCAYGWTGPWSGRRGFDSLVQMSCGIAEAGQRWAGAARPTPLPVQALDHATGYLMAAAAIRGLAVRRDHGLATTARLSLARTAALLVAAGDAPPGVPIAGETDADRMPQIEATDWGEARRLRLPFAVAGIEGRFERPARRLRSEPDERSATWESNALHPRTTTPADRRSGP
jgi:crotonobetainyl-CoA:carnitine CoA-transferase CaiB-like acyl-CoA transferase